jgi:hypothetical protein
MGEQVEKWARNTLKFGRCLENDPTGRHAADLRVRLPLAISKESIGSG